MNASAPAWLDGLLGDPEVREALSGPAQLRAMLRFEAELALAQAETGLLPDADARAVATLCASFEPDVDALAAGTLRDGVVVPELVRQLRAAAGDGVAPFVHFGATSQDVVDTALVLGLRDVLGVYAARLDDLVIALDALDARFGTRPLDARTRMRRALPATVSDRIATWRAPLIEHARALPELERRVARVQLGGAIGTLEAFDDIDPDPRPALRTSLARRLDLADPGRAWHTERIALGDLGARCAGLTASLAKLGADAGLMVQDGIDALTLGGAGRSSAMPHKRNPVPAEVLVALARHAATLAGGLHQAGTHEQERSGAAWTLEWLSLPPLLECTGAALSSAARLLAAVESLGEPAP